MSAWWAASNKKKYLFEPHYTATNRFLFIYTLTKLRVERIFVVKPVNRRQLGNQDMDGMILKWNMKMYDCELY
jgi:hypothetical protein